MRKSTTTLTPAQVYRFASDFWRLLTDLHQERSDSKPFWA